MEHFGNFNYAEVEALVREEDEVMWSQARVFKSNVECQELACQQQHGRNHIQSISCDVDRAVATLPSMVHSGTQKISLKYASHVFDKPEGGKVLDVSSRALQVKAGIKLKSQVGNGDKVLEQLLQVNQTLSGGKKAWRS